MNYFGFQHALDLINSGFTVGVHLDGKSRIYFKNKNGQLVCTTNNTTYSVKCFYLDAVMSKKWYLV